MRTFILKKKIIILIILTLIAISTSLYAYAYFENNQNYGFVIETGEFEVISHISFSDIEIDINSQYYDADNQVVIIDAYNPQAVNYIGKLKVDIVINPNIAARVRIKLLDEWELTRTYSVLYGEEPIDPLVQTVYHTAQSSLFHPFSLLKVGSNYIPIYDNNGYAYITEVLQKNEETIIHLIDGGDGYPTRENEIYSETCFVHLRFSVDVVQANRFAELWSLDPDFFD
ncbi:MAG: hypothetical protein K9L02_05420 [Acholeplasmataceae bacterium]|nr:hypothetical protein [Acholeplasmataceae bacterium]